ncbi:MAG: SoxR reducing system RseC family protein [Glaciecola sp.]
MIEETGIVVAVENDYVWVETQVKTTCSSCKASEACPTSTVAKAFSPKAEHIKLKVPCALAVGQQVKLGISEQALLRASAMVYILPLVLLILTTAVLQNIANLHELLSLLLGTAAALGGFWWASRYSKKTQHQHKFVPVFLGATQQAVVTHKHEIPVHKL